MRKLLSVFAVALLLSNLTNAQTALPAKQEIDKVQLEGLTITTKIDAKNLEKYWETLLKKYGKPSTSAWSSVYKLTAATIPSISPDPINIVSKVSSSKGTSQVFMYVDMGGGAFVAQGTKGYAEVDGFLRQFVADSQLQDDVRIAEEGMKDSEKNYQKMLSKGERLKKDIEKTTKELENLKKELEINGKDQVTAQTDLDAKKKAFDDTKLKLPKN